MCARETGGRTLPSNTTPRIGPNRRALSPFLQGLDAVLSDMCHFTHGNSVADAYKSLDLARCAWAVATGGEGAEAADPNLPFSRGVLRPGGSLVMKLLQASGARAAPREQQLPALCIAHPCLASNNMATCCCCPLTCPAWFV
jgi:23S rRNA U2552 (ribose-2'-O)-methylase RlmE/FtsJ